MSIESLCSRHSITVTRKTASIGLGGAQSFTYATVGTVRCWVQEHGATEVTEDWQRGYHKSHTIYFSSDPSIQNGDRLTFDGKTLTALNDAEHSLQMGRLWKVEAEELEADQ